MELLLVRHALPVRVDNSANGEPADPGLSDLGWRQSSALADWLTGAHPGGAPAERIDAVYASTRTRARQTAEPLAAGDAFLLVDEPAHEVVAAVPTELLVWSFES